MKQTTFASMSFAAKKRRTRREKFLAEMEQVVPWAKLIALIEPYYPKTGRRGRPPMRLESMPKREPSIMQGRSHETGDESKPRPLGV